MENVPTWKNLLRLVGKKAVLLSIFLLVSVPFFSQENSTDTLVIDTTKRHSPKRATWMSAVLPGLGQVYNKKYWKVPVIYAGVGASLYFAVSNGREFKRYKTAYVLRLDGDSTTVDEFDGFLTDTGIASSMDFHQRNRDLSYIVAGLFYVLNIIDASVDAHLFHFPVNDNLSFDIKPDVQFSNNFGLQKGLTFTFHL